MLVGGCGPQVAQTDTAHSSIGATSGASAPEWLTTGTSATSVITATSSLSGYDLPDWDPGPSGCDGCSKLDVVIVVDNSAGMADKQKRFAAAIPGLVTRLRDLVDTNGAPVVPDVHVMVTTTDMGHYLLCDPFKMPDYEPAMGAPIGSACVDRLARFTGLGDGAEVRPDVCLDHCPEGQAAAPSDVFVAFAGESHNVVGADGGGDPVVDALKCLVPQGIDGCGMEASLEGMLQALDPNKPWNSGPAPFLRRDSALALVILTDETDCSVQDPSYFDPKHQGDPEFGQYWEGDSPTSAICWNGSMACTDADDDGVFETCAPEDRGVLQPLSRYVNYLDTVLAEQRGQPVFMLVVAGLPETGIDDLVIHDWTEADLLPGDDESAAEKQAEWGVGPGCSDPGVGYALPPGRVREVCRSLDVADDPDTPVDESRVRCCFQSTCAVDVASGFDCLADALGHSLAAAR